VLPGAMVAVTDVDRSRAEALARDVAAFPGVVAIEVAGSVREAVDGADVVVSAVSFGPNRQTLDPAWLLPDVLFVAVDYDMQAPASLARDSFFLTDDREQFIASRRPGQFEDYPDPDATIGEVLRERTRRPAGRVLAAHLGVGLADVVFAAAILRRAEELGLGRVLPR